MTGCDHLVGIDREVGCRKVQECAMCILQSGCIICTAGSPSATLSSHWTWRMCHYLSSQQLSSHYTIKNTQCDQKPWVQSLTCHVFHVFGIFLKTEILSSPTGIASKSELVLIFVFHLSLPESFNDGCHRFWSLSLSELGIWVTTTHSCLQKKNIS